MTKLITHVKIALYPEYSLPALKVEPTEDPAKAMTEAASRTAEFYSFPKLLLRQTEEISGPDTEWRMILADSV